MKDQQEVEHQPSEKGAFVVVGVGASAGGLQALEDFFRGMPPNPGAAFVVIQHLSPDYKSLMVELLGRRTEIPVIRAEDGMLVERDRIYLIPPKKNMTIADGQLRLEEQDRTGGLSLPIDIFFRSLAQDAEERAVGIVLSGTGSDGALGIRAIKGAGGLVMVQDPDTAKFDGMPRSAMASMQVDFALPVDQLATKLLGYVHHPGFELPDTSRAAGLAGRSAMDEALAIVYEQHDLDFSVYRRTSMQRRLQKRMQMNQIEDLPQYVALLRRSREEVKALFQDALIGVTRFFRDPEAFEALREPLAELVAQRDGKELRMWVQACSTGEEAYSIAMLVLELLEDGARPNLKIFATDVDPVALRYASAGVYPEAIVADVPARMLERYFRHEGTSYRVNESLRKSVIFSPHNVLKDPPFNRMDVVTCRNFLIYLESPAQQHVLSRFSFSLDKGGLLLMGPSESLGDLGREFDTLSHRWKLYRRRTARSTLALSRRVQWSGAAPVPPSPRVPMEPLSARAQADRRLFRSVMAELAPPTLVVDETGRVLMTYGAVTKYIELQPGPVSYDLQNVVSGSLAVVLGTALHRARSEGKRVVYPNVPTGGDGSGERIDLVVSPLVDGPDGGLAFGVVFREGGARDGDKDAKAILLPPDQTLMDLQQELQYTKENLQATIEELETSNEELQATNEELLSSNEELQSTNEELQSVNEELVTVNTEHQLKIQELTELNNDLDNFFTSSDTSTLFLDQSLRIRKFSPSVAKHFNLLPNDIGRPLKHFTFGLNHPGFFEAATRVIETLEPSEREVPGLDGRWILVRMIPYRNRENRAGGLVISFVDTTEHRAVSEELVRYRAVFAELEKEKIGTLGGRARRVLLVEDDPDQWTLLKGAMENSHVPVEVDVAETGAEALECLAQNGTGKNKYDVVLLDLHLPDMEGFEVLRQIKTSPKIQSIPVIVVSAETDPAAVRKAYDMHASCFITKPAALHQLPVVLESVKEHWFTVVQLPGDKRAY